MFGCPALNARPGGCANAQTDNAAGCHAFNVRPEGCAKNQRGFFAGRHAFNARPEGATSSQPRASERSERHPGLGRRVSDTPPKGAKATIEAFNHADNPPVTAFAPSGGVSERILPNPGCRSLRSLALGWELATPSGFCVERLPSFARNGRLPGCQSRSFGVSLVIAFGLHYF